MKTSLLDLTVRFLFGFIILMALVPTNGKWTTVDVLVTSASIVMMVGYEIAKKTKKRW